MKWNKITSPSEPEFPTEKLVVSYRETGSYIPTNSKSAFSASLEIKNLKYNLDFCSLIRIVCQR